ncbi:MAG: PIN domain-containing protein [Imperialibacter sp.]|jgi:predicted nucleic acid-binding protein|uniref:PIN domain-containing protein n=1 Tax=Imperialibacter roseus TaxID=1324217 RepID=A0ABZ0IIF4_9BACT|nr:PIN domain-containing protein [Imperialibacter roseus]WOK04818.1 PIN domain-containing protein [Imperialibacter roseus]|tara:strand:+ start:390 stop:851 length:462 start_codon:yes stop_codon:yes gene_type:complete
MIKRVYIDTSVFGGYFDSEFDNPTKIFFKTLNTQNTTILVSQILELEIYKAPDHIIELFESLSNIERVELTGEVKQLAEMYITEKVVGRTSIADCQHIALATINKADVLASWNFKHIVNLERIRGYNSINFREGYQMTEIRTPNEIFRDEDGN